MGTFIGEIKDLPMLINADDIAKVFRVSKGRAYQMMKQLPTVKIGRSVRVRKEDFVDWIVSNVDKVVKNG